MVKTTIRSPRCKLLTSLACDLHDALDAEEVLLDVPHDRAAAGGMKGCTKTGGLVAGMCRGLLALIRILL